MNEVKIAERNERWELRMKSHLFYFGSELEWNWNTIGKRASERARALFIAHCCRTHTALAILLVAVSACIVWHFDGIDIAERFDCQINVFFHFILRCFSRRLIMTNAKSFSVLFIVIHKYSNLFGLLCDSTPLAMPFPWRRRLHLFDGILN